MSGLTAFWLAGDGVARAVALLLLAMSVSSWALIFWKGRHLRRAAQDLPRCVGRWWQSPDVTSGREQVAALDREQVLLPLVDAALEPDRPGTLDAQTERSARLTRRLRDALQGVLGRLAQGQVVLASVGSTAPFVGLFGTVWGVYHALVAVSAEGAMTLERVSGPVGEALVMTAAGLAVAIPAVLAYNLFGQRLSACEVELEGFAHDLRAWAAGPNPQTAPAPRAGVDAT